MSIIKKNCKVSLILTGFKKVEEDQLVFGAGGYLFQTRKADNIGSLDAVCLYITTNEEEVKKGEYYFTNDTNELMINNILEESIPAGVVQKLLISDDPELDFLRPSNKFIRMFVEEYNKGNIIKEVEIEYNSEMGVCDKCGAYQYASYIICNYHEACGGKVIPIQKISLDIDSKVKISIPESNSLIRKMCEVNPELKKEIKNLLIDCVGQSHDWSRENNDIHSIGVIKERFLNNWIKQNIG